MPDPLDPLIAAARAYAPGQSLRLRLRRGDGVTVRVDVPSCPVLCPAVVPVKVPPESPCAAAILEVLKGLGPGEKMTGQKLSEAAGYPFVGHFRDTLTSLVRAGKVLSCRPGYRLPGQ